MTTIKKKKKQLKENEEKKESSEGNWECGEDGKEHISREVLSEKVTIKEILSPRFLVSAPDPWQLPLT